MQLSKGGLEYRSLDPTSVSGSDEPGISHQSYRIAEPDSDVEINDVRESRNQYSIIQMWYSLLVSEHQAIRGEVRDIV